MGAPTVGLRQAGVQVNKSSLPSCQSIHSMKEGSAVQQGTPIVTGTHEIPDLDEDALIAALRADQEGRVMFPEFLQASRKAGVVGYDVDFALRRVTHYGAKGESHAEAYAAVEVSR